MTITSTGMSFFALTIAFIAKPFNAFIPGIVSTLFLTWAVIYTLILHYELTRITILFARKKIIRLLSLKKSEFAQLKRIDPFRKVWLWGYVFPFLILLLVSIASFLDYWSRATS